MTSETDEHFVEQMEKDWNEDLTLYDMPRLFALARRGAAVQEAATALYLAGRWSCAQPVDEAALWTALRDALGLPVGTETARAALGEERT